MSTTSLPKGVQISCKNSECKSLKFLQYLNFNKALLFTVCAKCATPMFYIPLDPEEALEFEKDYIKQELAK